jgi:cytochrome b involved in lipid metabolism
MRKLFIISTTIFWLAVAGFWLSGKFHTPQMITQTATVAEPALRKYSLKEVSQHNRENNCWMAIEGQVYDLTAYLPTHPSDPAIVLPWCGKEASNAWQTKTVGRPHTSRAKHLLERYLIGKLNETP